MERSVIRIHRTGGPEVLSFEEETLPPPAQGEVQLRQTAVGLNFIDVYHRTGLYPLPLPAVLGREAAGVVEAVGAGVASLQPGMRVAYPMATDAYASARNIRADLVVPLPDGIEDGKAAAMMLKGLTAWYLLRRTFPVTRGTAVLVHAAAGGVGLIACQWAAALGATVLGTVGSRAKAELAAAHGCAHPIVYTEEDFVARVRTLTGGRGVDVVYDSVGKDTFPRSLDCLRPKGLVALFGQSSGPVPPFDLQVLSQKGSLFVTRPTLATYIAERAELQAGAAELFEAVQRGQVRIEIGGTYPLRDVQQAHRDLEARKTTGSTILLP
ncbi:MAG TPA: quinone oxidoreductase [Candidatus Polarisedimenticolaceae bacterium]|nr:quinone oxidoreductase [Candidatus Polarisedimenticolaceae bacterium]